MLSALQKNTAWISACFYTFTSPCKAHCHQRVWCHPTAAVRPTLCAAEIPRAQHSAAAKAFCWHLLKAREREISLCVPPFIAAHQEPAGTALCSSAWETHRLDEWGRHLEHLQPFQQAKSPFFPSHLFPARLWLPHITVPWKAGIEWHFAVLFFCCFSPAKVLHLNVTSLIIWGMRVGDGCIWANNKKILSARQEGRSDGYGENSHQLCSCSFIPFEFMCVCCLLVFPSKLR